MPRYDVNVTWDDPFERPVERRGGKRFNFKARVNITAERDGNSHHIVGPGLIRNMSQSGMYLVTKHRLKPSQWVTLTIPTKHVRDIMCVPEAFVGPAEVVRVEGDREGRSNVALRYGGALTSNMEFVLFLEQLENMATVAVER